MTIREATETDIPVMEEFVAAYQDDFWARPFPPPSIADYVREGRLLVAERDGRVVGFALLEVSSLGLNFSELTNAFTVHLLEEDEDAHRALVVAAQRRYAEIGRSHCVALAEGEHLLAFEEAGFARVKDYACWTFHRDHMSDLEEYFAKLFGARGRRRA